ncbi:hypothetical protein POTOM_043433 [Populus tomentosa]|uniref:Uncharacterized protein n=1 Tax=Populus tomentosa TaxID=118781 RepID=A0A8X8CGN6_POPTO|nr:hypothetical protein POTOM_043433 [Populus tomentosa]
MATHKCFSSACRAFITISRPIWPRFRSRSMRLLYLSRLVSSLACKCLMIHIRIFIVAYILLLLAVQFDRQRLFTTILNPTCLANGEGSTVGTLIFDNELVSMRNQ